MNRVNGARARTHRRRCSLAITVNLAVVGFLAADQAPGCSLPLSLAPVRAVINASQLGSTVSAAQLFGLRAAFRAAESKLRKKPSCRALFDNLELSGESALERSRYRGAEFTPQGSLCTDSRVAFTVVGHAEILICREFYALPRARMIGVLIHEALHTAGLNEAPYDPNGLDSTEITRMVTRACTL